MSMRYYLRCGRLITGPFGEPQIREKFRTGQITAATEISTDKQHWEKLKSPLAPTVVIPAAPAAESVPEIPPAVQEAPPEAIPLFPDPAPEITLYPELAEPEPESCLRIIGSTLQLMWDCPVMLTYLSAELHPRRNTLIAGTAAGFLLLLAVLSATVLNTVLHRGADMWFFCSCSALTIWAVIAAEGIVLRWFRPSENVVLADALILECTGAGAVPVLLFWAGRPLLLQAGFPVLAMLWGTAVLAAAAFFTVQLAVGLSGLLIREHGFSVRMAAVLTAGILWQQGVLIGIAVKLMK